MLDLLKDCCNCFLLSLVKKNLNEHIMYYNFSFLIEKSFRNLSSLLHNLIYRFWIDFYSKQIFCLPKKQVLVVARFSSYHTNFFNHNWIKTAEPVWKWWQFSIEIFSLCDLVWTLQPLYLLTARIAETLGNCSTSPLPIY